jgi:hypothetical protein
MQPHYRDGFIEGIHYHKEKGQIMFTALFHMQRGKCCGNGCSSCPFEPRHKRNSDKVAEKFAYLEEKS